MAHAERLDQVRLHADRQRRLANERRQKEAAEARRRLDAAEAQRQEEERRREERQLMVRPAANASGAANAAFVVHVFRDGSGALARIWRHRSERTGPMRAPTLRWTPSRATAIRAVALLLDTVDASLLGDAPTASTTFWQELATRTASTPPLKTLAVRPTATASGAAALLMDALHAKDQDAVMNVLSELLTAPRVIGTSSLDDASAPSKGSRAAPVDVVLAPLLDDARVTSKSSSRARAARTTSRLALVWRAARRGTTRTCYARADGAGRDALSTSTFCAVDGAREIAARASTRAEAPSASSSLWVDHGRVASAPAGGSVTALFDYIGDSITGLRPFHGQLRGGTGGDDDDEHALGARMDGSVEIVPMINVVSDARLQTRWRDALAEGERAAARGDVVQKWGTFDLKEMSGNMVDYFVAEVDGSRDAYRAGLRDGSSAALQATLTVRRDLYKGPPRKKTGVFYQEKDAYDDLQTLEEDPPTGVVAKLGAARSDREDVVAYGAEHSYAVKLPFEKVWDAMSPEEQEACQVQTQTGLLLMPEREAMYDPESGCACERGWWGEFVIALDEYETASANGNAAAAAAALMKLRRLTALQPVVYSRYDAKGSFPVTLLLAVRRRMSGGRKGQKGAGVQRRLG